MKFSKILALAAFIATGAILTGCSSTPSTPAPTVSTVKLAVTITSRTCTPDPETCGVQYRVDATVPAGSIQGFDYCTVAYSLAGLQEVEADSMWVYRSATLNVHNGHGDLINPKSVVTATPTAVICRKAGKA